MYSKKLKLAHWEIFSSLVVLEKYVTGVNLKFLALKVWYLDMLILLTTPVVATTKPIEASIQKLKNIFF